VQHGTRGHPLRAPQYPLCGVQPKINVSRGVKPDKNHFLHRLAGRTRSSEPVSIDLAATVQTLRRVRVADDETFVPLEARPLLTVLKHQLRDLITLTLNEQVSESSSLEAFRKALTAELEKQERKNFGDVVSNCAFLLTTTW
jgi:hypothetical protein